ncbi:nitroreductase [Desulfovibrio sp. X2]|uniref:nitroreductase family protein n=1 Tax=Desulfovibrio sp. X2 TaxID=941449 RepID=UPI000358D9EF|nr:nitroreductase [Desulfovibrio sp. X2]EPR41764.1 nitroreductase [Desulfovibrio sp. X2]
MNDAARAAVLGALRERRSIRKYTDEPVADDEVRAVLEAGRWAPSGKNNQPWRFLAVRRGEPRQEALARHTKYAHIVRGAGALVCVFLERARMYDARKDHQGAGACLQNMLLAAHALGLGAVWIGEIVNREPEVVAAVGVDPEAYEMMAVIALGRPAQEGSSDRIPLESLMLEPF